MAQDPVCNAAVGGKQQHRYLHRGDLASLPLGNGTATSGGLAGLVHGYETGFGRTTGEVVGDAARSARAEGVEQVSFSELRSLK